MFKLKRASQAFKGFVVLGIATLSFIFVSPASAGYCDDFKPWDDYECYEEFMSSSSSSLETVTEAVTFAEPQVVDGSFLDTRFYVRLADNANVYAQPSRAAPVIRNVGDGFLFSTIFSIQQVDGVSWYEINFGEFVHQEDIIRMEISQFRGIEVLRQPERPFGWIVQNVQPSSAPDVEPNEDVEELERYTFFEVYDVAVGAEDWLWYQIEDGRWIRQTYVSLVEVTKPPAEVGEGEYWTQVDVYEQTFAAYEGERMVYATLVSTGLNQWPTYEGVYQVEARFKEYKMSGATGQPDFYFIEDVPNIMYFDMFNGIALHGAYWHDRFGFKQSHGCVNMPPYAAEWVFNWSENAPNALWVNVYTSDPSMVLEA